MVWKPKLIVHFHIKTPIKDGQSRANSLTGSTQLRYGIYGMVDISDNGAILNQDNLMTKQGLRANFHQVRFIFETYI